MCSIIGYCGIPTAPDAFLEGFDKTVSRGPDDSRVIDTGKGLLGFHRLAIMGLTPEGMQPFSLDGSYVVCNGEIYGFEKLKAALSAKYTFKSGSDCEILLPMYREYGTDMFRMLDAEFALILFDGERGEYIAARDPIGIRPLYYGYDKEGVILLPASRKTWWDFASARSPSHPDITIKAGNLSPIATSRMWSTSAGTILKPFAATFTISSLQAWKSGWSPTQRWAFCSRAVWTPRLSAPLPRKRVQSPSAPLPSAWTRTLLT